MQQESPSSYADLPTLVLQQIFQCLDENSDLARCELVCQRWLAVMQDSPSLWQSLRYCGSSGRLGCWLGELRWLARRPGPVVEAFLEFNDPYERQELPLAFACLGQWSGTLQSLGFQASGLPSLSFLAALPHLTQLAVDATVLEVESSRHRVERQAPCFHQKLRILSWSVSYDEEAHDAEHRLPTLPTTLQHLRVSVGPGSITLPSELSQLQRLQSLRVCALLTDEASALSLFGPQTSLTYLSFQSSLEVLPAGLSLLTALRCLVVSECHFGYSDEGLASLQAVQYLPRLEFLDISYCRLEELPQLSWATDPPPLRVLLVQGNACPLNQGWLAHVQRLACGWQQVPDNEDLGLVANLRTLSLVPAAGKLDNGKHIFQHLDQNSDRARCELVCRRWMTAMIDSSPSLWQRVHYDSREKQQPSLGELNWLARRPGPVVQAVLYLGSRQGSLEVPLVLLCLGVWAGTLRSLSLEATSLPSLGFLSALPHLTRLAVGVTLLASETLTYCEREALSPSQPLRSLSWKVEYEDNVEDVIRDLPPLPTSLQHLEVAVHPGLLELPSELSQLRQLQSLQSRHWLANYRDAISWGGARTSLTYLSFRESNIDVLPPGLSLLTALRCLVANDCNLGYSEEGMVSLLALEHLPHLEYLDISCCWMGRLPELFWPSPAPLRVLIVDGNACIPTQGWLTSLQQLACSWHQVPEPEELSLAVKLHTVSLVPAEGKLDSSKVVSVLNSLQALPNMRRLHFQGTDMTWVEEVVAAFAALCWAKPGLQVLGKTLGFEWFPPTSDFCGCD
ncbi:hypothetical protein N2152v2_003316 [Parachlorella kessleri]